MNTNGQQRSHLGAGLGLALLIVLPALCPAVFAAGTLRSGIQPRTANDHAAALAPDLAVTRVDASGVTGDWQTLQIAGAVTVAVSNPSDTDVSTPFTVLLFEDTNRDGTYDAALDTLLGSAPVAGVAARASVEVAAAVSGRVLFRDNLIYAFADSGNVVEESNEANNLSSSGASCEFEVPIGAFNPVVEWEWSSSDVLPDSLNVEMTPVIMDMNHDGIPDVVFGSTESRGGSSVEVGVLRALSGAGGAELFTVTDPAYAIDVASSIAAGDIDGDGLPEIIATDASGQRLIVFENDGTFKWRSDNLEPVNWGAPAIADLNGDGTPEIVVGRQVLSNTGAILWTGTAGRAAQHMFTGPLSIVADIDLDGTPEIVAGNTVYRSNGEILWQAKVTDGYNAVANFDADPAPEIVLVSFGKVYLLENDGSVIWGPVAIPGGGDGGPPTVADYDGDGSVEIGVAGAARYAVFETDGSLKWEAVTQDISSNVTGSSVFDFDGDKSVEVVYRDELFLRVYRGSDGTVLYQVPMSSCTWFEYVLVADVDGDGNAELVAVANDSCGFGTQRGVFVYGDANDAWVATRKIWNEHSYHITNVNDDGTIPAVEPDNWLFPAGAPYNNYRQNVLTGLSPFAAPDLTASYLTFERGRGSFAITGRVGNGGAIVTGAGLPVSFYNGMPSAASLLGTVHTTQSLEPGQFEDVTLSLQNECHSQSGRVTIVADDAGGLVGTQNECDETNNSHSALIPAITRCGDGHRDPGEECDDGNQADRDGCSHDCHVEHLCGNGVRDHGEQCDDGNVRDRDGCSHDCRIESVCGNGVREPGEQCDDGNHSDRDGCSHDCHIERGCRHRRR